MKNAQLIVQTLRAQGVRYIFGVPGAKIDEVYDALVDTDDIEVVVCRHEQNATFMAQAIGRLTGKPGVVLVTSGPGTTNLATGLVTANTEQDPVVAIAGTVGLPDRLKRRRCFRPSDVRRDHDSSGTARLLLGLAECVGDKFRNVIDTRRFSSELGDRR